MLYDFYVYPYEYISIDGFVRENIYWEDEVICLSVGFEDFRNIYQDVRTFELDYWYFGDNVKFYEGIGSSTGLFTIFTTDAWETILVGHRYGDLGTEDTELNNLTLFPNPFTNEIHLDANKPIRQLQLYNTAGQLILNKKSLNELNAELGGLDKGVFILKITFPDGNSKSVKVIKNG